jgi:hypothetical protein
VSDRWFESRSGLGIRVAVVDSGISAAHPHVAGIAGGVALEPDGSEGADVADRLGHGTAVAAAIREKAPGAELYAVKVFDRRLATAASSLVRALDWSTRQGMRLANLSLGTANPEHAGALAAALERCRAGGCTVVAARAHDGVRWYPGSLPGVLPVLLDWDCSRSEYRVDRGPDGPVFRASGFPRPIPGVPPERNLKGISFAVAAMTAFAARALEAHPGAGPEELVERLASQA